jgi:glycosyltransferase involved in cell wall biosynthesis
MQLITPELGKIVDLQIVTHHSDKPMAKIENAKVHYLPASYMQILKIKRQWLSLLKTIQPDVVHINGCWIPFCALIQKWSQQLGYKVILTPHGMLEPWIIQRHYWTRKLPALLLYQKNAIKKADCIFSTVEAEKQNILKLGFNNRIEIIPYGIDVEHAQIKSSWSKTKKILFMSRIHPKKGIELLIQAIAQIKDSVAEYKIIIAGEGNEEYVQLLKNKTQDQNVSHLFDFVGGIYGDKKWKLLRDSDFLILPTYSENFGIIVAESLISGTPVISTTGTPWKELNTHCCGWWINQDVDIIIQTLKEAIALSADEYQQMGIRGRELIKNNYSVEKIAEKMLHLYQWILQQREKPEFVKL